MNDISADHRCLECFKGATEVEFARSSRGVPHNICTDCAHKISARRVLERAEAENAKQMTQFIKATISTKVRASQWQDLVTDLFTRFGGPVGLGEKIFVHIDTILTKQPGTPLALKALEFVSKIIKEGVAEETAEIQVSNLTDDQLDTALDRYLTSRFNVKLPAPVDHGNGDSD